MSFLWQSPRAIFAMMLEIDQWLSGNRDYLIGVALFEKHGSGAYLKQMLAQGETPYNSIKLAEELTKLAKAGRMVASTPDDMNITKQPEQPPAAKKPHPKSLWRDDLLTLPENIQELYRLTKHLYKENVRRHAELMEYVRIALAKGVDTAGLIICPDAGVRVNEVLDADDELADLFEQMKFFEATGKLPEKESMPELDMTALEMMKELKNKRSFISKQRNNAARAAEVEDAKKRVEVLEGNLKRLE